MPGSVEKMQGRCERGFDALSDSAGFYYLHRLEAGNLEKTPAAPTPTQGSQENFWWSSDSQAA